MTAGQRISDVIQLALAWHIQTSHPDAEIRLERRLLSNPTVALDILLRLDGLRLGLELKYLKADLALELDGEAFVLRPGAPDVERYDFLKDVMRLERLRHEELIDAGCALLLSNETAFGGSRRALQPPRLRPSACTMAGALRDDLRGAQARAREPAACARQRSNCAAATRCGGVHTPG